LPEQLHGSSRDVRSKLCSLANVTRVWLQHAPRAPAPDHCFSETPLLNSIDHRVVVNRPPGFIVNINLREACFLVAAKSVPEPREEYQHQNLN
jgi:hypothetical protein